MKKITFFLITIILCINGCNQDGYSDKEGKISVLEKTQVTVAIERMKDQPLEIVQTDEETTDNCKWVTTAIIEENKENMLDFLEKPLVNDEYYYQKYYAVIYFDFTFDGQEEIILSETISWKTFWIQYNYVYDSSGEKLFAFPTVGNIDLYKDEINKKIYIHSSGNNGTRSLIHLYGEVSTTAPMEAHYKFAEWDIRDGRAQDADEEEGYYIFENFTQEEQFLMGESYRSLVGVFESKEDTDKRTELEKYKGIFSMLEIQEYEWSGPVLGEEGRVVWYVEGIQNKDKAIAF